MKILFVVKSKAIETLGSMYLAAVVKQCGHEARIVELKDALDHALAWKPGVIGYSMMTGDSDKFKTMDGAIRKAARRLRRWSYHTMWGGAHVTFFPDDFRSMPGVLVQGEAENRMAEFCGRPDQYQTLDDIPYPDRTDFPNMPIRDFLASRGCPHSCRYCYNSSWKKMFPKLPLVRYRSVENVIKEIEEVKPEFAYFQDSCFGVKMPWLREFSREYKRRLSIPYHVHLRPGMVTEERVKLLHDSNCVSVKIALETANHRLRVLINRGKQSNEEVCNAAIQLRTWGVKLILQNILGLPTSTVEEDLETLEVNVKCRPAYSWSSIFTPYPGTVLGDMCKAEGWYKGDYSEISDSFFDKSVLEFDDLHKEQVVALQRVFALCVEHQYLPQIDELRIANIGNLTHKIMRRVGDRRMFPGISLP